MGFTIVGKLADGLRVLFFTGSVKVIKEYIPVFEELRSRGACPVVFIDWECPQQWMEALEQRSIPFIKIEGALKCDRETCGKSQDGCASRGLSSSGGPTLRQRLKKTLIGREWRQIRIFFNILAEAHQWRKILIPLFDLVNPDEIVLPSEGNVRRMAPLKIAQERGIPGLILPLFYPTPEMIFDCCVDNEDWQELHTERSLVNRWVMRLRPRCVYRREGMAILRDPGGEMLATWYLGMLPRNNWTWGTGLAQKVAVQNHYEYGKMLAAGAVPERLALTGKPREDIVYRQMRSDRLADRRSLGIKDGHKVLVFSLPHYAEHHMLSWEKHWEQITFLLSTAEKLSDVVTVLSLYPESDVAVYRSFLKHFKAVLPENNDVFRLIGLCDVYMTNSRCSTISSAIGAHKPVVAFNFLGEKWAPYYQDVSSGVNYIGKREDLEPALTGLLSEGSRYQESVRLQERAAQELCMLDGASTRRVVDELYSLHKEWRKL